MRMVGDADDERNPGTNRAGEDDLDQRPGKEDDSRVRGTWG